MCVDFFFPSLLSKQICRGSLGCRALTTHMKLVKDPLRDFYIECVCVASVYISPADDLSQATVALPVRCDAGFGS